MKTNKRPYPISTSFSLRERINTNPDFQRPAVWSTAQKQMLVDTILRAYDIPKLYWRKVCDRPEKYEVVDGQQRLRAIWSFMAGEFNISKDADAVDGIEIANCSYTELPEDLRISFDQYPLDVVVLDSTDEDEVREMFLRLQNGTSLKAQEKRNAYPGAMRNFVQELSQHPFFSSVAFANSRFAHAHVAAQLVCLEKAQGPTNIKNADLNRLYKDNEKFDTKSPTAKNVIRTLDLLVKIFPEKTPELERYSVISLYCMAAELQRLYVMEDAMPHLRAWFLDFEEMRQKQSELPDDEAEAEWVSYREKTSHSTDAEDSIQFRMEAMLRRFLERHPGLRLKDDQRDFAHVQKLAIWRRDKGVCQLRIKCDGAQLGWDNWHCDHKTPWSKGGKTTVENGQVACPACNLAKGGKE